MFRLFFWLMLFSGSVLADSEILRLFSEEQHKNSLQMLQDVENQFSGLATDITTKQENDGIIYQVEMVDLVNNRIEKLYFDALSGQLLRKRTQDLTFVDTNKLQAVAKILERNQTLSNLLKKFTKSHAGIVLNARLDRDLGINYLELELLHVDGRIKLAFDLDQMQPLPLLTQS